MPENVVRLSETFSRAYDVMDGDKLVILGKNSCLHVLIVFVCPQLKILSFLHECFQVSHSLLWIFMTLQCIKASWIACRDSLTRYLKTGMVCNINCCTVSCFVLMPSHPDAFCLPSPCSFHILGNAGPALLQDFYTVESLAEGIIGSAFTSLDHVPDHRLRSMIHILRHQDVLSFIYTKSKSLIFREH